MRILQLRFLNLNSLLGEWWIDFTDPAYVSEGLFAVTGPTGAGKTTILDGICLALYGRTPRLEKVNKSTNEIISRQTGECYAEVTFETQHGRYRCHWSQHRARRQSGGELQTPRHEIAEAVSGRILASSLRTTAEQVLALTGMDFERFTRSMLLAQGGFAAFLQADPDERAPILEQITGSGIYSRISMRVHERRAEARNRLQLLRAELTGLQPLSKVEERQLQQSLEQKRQQESKLTGQLEDFTRALAWLDEIAGFEARLAALLQRRQAWQLQQEAFASEQQRLGRANQALELAGEHAALTALRRQQNEDAGRCDEYRQVMPARKRQIDQAAAVQRANMQRLEQRREEQREASAAIRETRALDVQIQEKAIPLKAARDREAELELAQGKLDSLQEQALLRLAQERSSRDKLSELLKKNPADEALLEQLAGLEREFEEVGQLHEEQRRQRLAVTRSKDEILEVNRDWEQRREVQQRHQDALAGILEGLKQKQSELQQLLQDQEPKLWRDRLAAQRESQRDLDAAIAALRSWCDAQSRLDQLLQREQTLRAELADEERRLAAERERQALREREEGLLEDQLTLLRRFESFTQARHQLRDGEPCPLCGAVEHPYALGNIPVAGATQVELERVRSALKQGADRLEQQQLRQAGRSKELELTSARRQETEAEVEATSGLLSKQCLTFSLDDQDPELERKLRGLLDRFKQELEHSVQVVEQAETLESGLNRLHTEMESIKENLTTAERAFQDATHKKAALERESARLQEVSYALERRMQVTLERLRQRLVPYGLVSLRPEELDRVLTDLRLRREQWRSRQQQCSELQQGVERLEGEIGHRAELLHKGSTDLGQIRGSRKGLQIELERLEQRRKVLFGEKLPDEEEQRLAEAVELARQGLQQAQLALTAENEDLAGVRRALDMLEQSMAERDGELREAEAGFVKRLTALGFQGEADYLAACLPETERKALSERARRLTQEHTGLDLAERDVRSRLTAENARALTDLQRDELIQRLESLHLQQKALHEEIGAIQQRLDDNAAVKQRQRDQMEVIEAQQQECSRWDLLHQLIGSADGKRYRNFAQGLTFEVVIGHANRQLQKMTDRYLLIRDESLPLELNVIDNYQAGEVRSTKNLSGGESFIVSLCLALGLSRMASRNVRVDSLFLDEGFGTLDEEALETALGALAGLQQEGKLIGVISHVPALKERIATRIEVIPQTGGRSMIRAPGCRGVVSA